MLPLPTQTEPETWLVLSIEVPGRPQGARRHRAARRGDRVVTFHSDDHLAAEERLRNAAAAQWRRRTPLDGPVIVSIETHHARPQRLKRKRDRGSGPLPYVGKPDADNVAKLVLDALTLAAVWRDDTLVAELVVRRRWLPLSVTGAEDGVPRTTVRVWRMA